jgi:deoxyribonuclease V
MEHRWDLSPEEAIALQRQLSSAVIPRTTFDPDAVQTVAGVDVSFPEGMARAAVVVLGFPDLEPLAGAVAEVPVSFPYVPGLLAFREGPAVLAALEKLGSWPDIFLFDAHGLSHQRRLGLASHLGVYLDRPSVGCAKSRLVGHHDVPLNQRGAWVPLLDGRETVGAVVRTREGVSPVYVSIGHRTDLPTAIELVLRCCTQYRLPETTRWAHRVAGGAELPPAMHQPTLF